MTTRIAGHFLSHACTLMMNAIGNNILTLLWHAHVYLSETNQAPIDILGIANPNNLAMLQHFRTFQGNCFC